ncbi:glucosaminidase domain-containing protein [Holdemania massiliensis]|uniref:glucosaminidase domain-containing protein n=1 Tax=Holdemania massiliensis TaxID=1468449 RepID=UPI001F067F84|nr:glucosaminidase domain-containing protein [Holdemania massiliensis]
MTVVELYQPDEPAYTSDMDVSWHEWQPIGKAAGVVPVALLDLAEEYNINPVYAAAVFVLETDWGSSSAWLNNHNPAGIRCGDRYCKYGTATDGLRRMMEIMADYYTNGLTTVAQQRSLWSETEDTEQIVQLMIQLAEGK